MAFVDYMEVSNPPAMPSILFINRVYPPDEGATGRVLEYLCRGLVAEGWSVSVLVTSDRKVCVGETNRDGVCIHRMRGVFSKKKLLLRALGYALMIPSFLFKTLSLPRADVVVTMTDPPMLLVIGPLIRLLKGSRLIHWAQDLYPEVAEELGVFPKGGLVARALTVLSSLAMRSHVRTVAVGRCMRKRLLDRGMKNEQIWVIPNTGVEREIALVPREDRVFRDRNGLGDDFIIEYSGNMGRAHEFETVLAAASQLQESGVSGILFLFIGNGPREGWLKEEVSRRSLNNVRFLPSQSSAVLGESLGAADLHLVTMRAQMEGLVVPSKFYGVMASARPCLFVGSADSEVAQVITELGIGEVILPGESAKIVSVIQAYRGSSERGLDEGMRARVAVEFQNATELFHKTASELLEKNLRSS